MKIGVLGMFYDCADLLPRVMEPWIALKNEGHDIIFGAINVQFKEYADIGYRNDDEATRSALEANRTLFDFLEIRPTPLRDHEARNVVLAGILPHDVDVVWLVDGDEIYTREHILGIISYLEKTPQFDYYHIPLDNHVLDSMRWDDGFTPPRIFRADRHGGLGIFVWENDFQFADGTKAAEIVPGIIPRSVAYVEHHTWGMNTVEKKIDYHKKHVGYCPYRYDPVTKQASFDPEYFTRWGQKMPVIKDGKAETPKQMFDVIFRTHTTGNFREGIYRVTDTLGGKPELAVRSLRSLINTLLVLMRANTVQIRLAMIDDHSDPQTLAKMHALLALCPFETTFIPLTETGHNASLRYCIDYAHEQGKDFIFMVEDDYVHEPTAALEMIESYRLFSHKLNRTELGLFPVDYSDFYLPDAIAPTRVVMGSRRHWRVSYSTTHTFFIPKSLLDTHWDRSVKRAGINRWDEEWINEIWQNHATLFSPIPTLSYHIHGADQMPPFTDWKKLWDSVAV